MGIRTATDLAAGERSCHGDRLAGGKEAG
jgi:hypothetical protein